MTRVPVQRSSPAPTAAVQQQPASAHSAASPTVQRLRTLGDFESQSAALAPVQREPLPGAAATPTTAAPPVAGAQTEAPNAGAQTPAPNAAQANPNATLPGVVTQQRPPLDINRLLHPTMTDLGLGMGGGPERETGAETAARLGLRPSGGPRGQERGGATSVGSERAPGPGPGPGADSGTPTRAATAGDLASALAAVPEVQAVIERAREAALSGSPGQVAARVGTGLAIAGTAIAGLGISGRLDGVSVPLSHGLTARVSWAGDQGQSAQISWEVHF